MTTTEQVTDMAEL